MRAGSEAIHWRMKFEPMNPAPPVTRMRSSMLMRHGAKTPPSDSSHYDSRRRSRVQHRSRISRLGRYGLAGGDSFGVKDRRQAMNYGRQPHRREDRFLRHAFAAENLLVRIDAKSAAIDCRDGSAPEFEIDLINAVTAQNVH